VKVMMAEARKIGMKSTRMSEQKDGEEEERKRQWSREQSARHSKKTRARQKNAAQVSACFDVYLVHIITSRRCL